MEDRGFDVNEALREASSARNKARRALYGFVGRLLALWGFVYVVMYGGGALGWTPAWLWLPLDAVAFALSFWLGARVGGAFRTAEGRRLKRIWAWFGTTMVLVVFAFAWRAIDDPLFSFVVNLLVGYALLQSGEAVPHRGLVRGGLLLLLVNTASFAFWPAQYAYALAAIGALALVAGLRQVR
jgi:hypothetical protein